MERGISRVESGEHDAALADFREAERVAEQAGLDDLVIASRINQGYAYSVHGDTESAIRLHEQAAELSRAAGDTERLALSLANLTVGLQEQGRPDEAVAALTEYMGLLGDEDAADLTRGLVNRATLYAEMGDNMQAAADLDDADLAAAQTGDPSLLYLVRMNQANLYLRGGDLFAAQIVLDQAVDAAKETGDPAQLQEALMSLAQVFRLSGQGHRADELFTQVEDQYREHGETIALADALYWHGAALMSLKRHQSALAKWREEEVLLRQRGQEGHLAECLFAQADALRLEGDDQSADPLFREAIDIFTALNMTEILPSVLYWHGMSLRSAGKSDEALTRADEALELATSNGDSGVERRALGLRVMALADLGEIVAALEALDTAEALCEQTESHSTMVWMLARRAYVIARDGSEPHDVVEQLRKAHLYALSHQQHAASRTAVRKIATEIVSHCDDTYLEPLEAFRREQLEELDLILNGGMPPGSLPSPSEVAPSESLPLEGEEFDDSSEEA